MRVCTVAMCAAVTSSLLAPCEGRHVDCRIQGPAPAAVRRSAAFHVTCCKWQFHATRLQGAAQIGVLAAYVQLSRLDWYSSVVQVRPAG